MYLKLSENKGIELDIRWMNWTYSWFALMIELSPNGRDHAGFEFLLQIWRLKFELNILDRRHWNYKQDSWFDFGEDMQEYVNAAKPKRKSSKKKATKKKRTSKKRSNKPKKSV